MRRAIEEIVDPGPRSIDELWTHFESRCAYCGVGLSRDRREGHADHAEPTGGNHLGNLVLACGGCNGDEKRDERWQDFLLRQAPNDAVFASREQRILAWFKMHPASPRIRESADTLRLRKELEYLVEHFGAKCGELKELLRDRV